MRTSSEEQTGVHVQTQEGRTVILPFKVFVAEVEAEKFHPEDWVWSRIVTSGEWVRLREMKIYQVLQEERANARRKKARQPVSDTEIWPPQIWYLNEKP